MIKIAIVENSETIRKGLELLINSTSEYSCIASFPDCDSMLKKIKETKPQILLIDINVIGTSAAEGIKKVKKISSGLVVLVLVIYMQTERVFDTICAGASGYIGKNSPSSHLLNALKLAHKGGSPMSAQIAKKIQDYFSKNKNGKHKLSSTEESILEELTQGNSYKAIANKLSLNTEAVQIHFRKIYEKLQQKCEIV